MMNLNDFGYPLPFHLLTCLAKTFTYTVEGLYIYKWIGTKFNIP